MMHHRTDLKAERRHVLKQPGFHDFGGIDVAFPAMGKAFFHEARDAAERLQIGRHAQIIQSNGHGGICLRMRSWLARGSASWPDGSMVSERATSSNRVRQHSGACPKPPLP